MSEKTAPPRTARGKAIDAILAFHRELDFEFTQESGKAITERSPPKLPAFIERLNKRLARLGYRLVEDGGSSCCRDDLGEPCRHHKAPR